VNDAPPPWHRVIVAAIVIGIVICAILAPLLVHLK